MALLMFLELSDKTTLPKEGFKEKKIVLEVKPFAIPGETIEITVAFYYSLSR